MNSIRKLCLFFLRPMARWVRAVLIPKPQPLQFHWKQIERGVASGCQIYIPTNTEMGDLIIAGTYEEKCLALIGELVSCGDTCFDIGGHYGYFALALSRFAKTGEVHCFEPVPTHAKHIQQAMERSEIDYTTVHQIAVAGESGEMVLRFANEYSHFDSMAYLENYGGVDSSAAKSTYEDFQEIRVKTITLDRLDLPAPQFIKIDTEGAEAHILRSGLSLISQSHPRMLIEMHSITAALECAEMLIPLGYIAILLEEQQNATLHVLWIFKNDDEAIQAVNHVTGSTHTILFQQLEL